MNGINCCRNVTGPLFKKIKIENLINKQTVFNLLKYAKKDWNNPNLEAEISQRNIQAKIILLL